MSVISRNIMVQKIHLSGQDSAGILSLVVGRANARLAAPAWIVLDPDSVHPLSGVELLAIYGQLVAACKSAQNVMAKLELDKPEVFDAVSGDRQAQLDSLPVAGWRKMIYTSLVRAKSIWRCGEMISVALTGNPDKEARRCPGIELIAAAALPSCIEAGASDVACDVELRLHDIGEAVCATSGLVSTIGDDVGRLGEETFREQTIARATTIVANVAQGNLATPAETRAVDIVGMAVAMRAIDHRARDLLEQSNFVLDALCSQAVATHVSSR